MSTVDLPTLAFLFLIVGALYASVGHAGASGYLAVMALMGVAPEVMRPTALAINILVATIALAQFARAGHFSWRGFWPFALLSVPAAFLGGAMPLSGPVLRSLIGTVLALTALRMVWTALRPRTKSEHATPPRRLVAVASGAGIGLVAGMTGTGGGIFLSPLILLRGWATTQQTAAISAAFILANSIAGTAGLVAKGWRPTGEIWWLALAACTGGAVGAHLGSRRFSSMALRLLLGAVLATAGAKLLLS